MFFNLLELKRIHRLYHLALRSCKMLRQIIYSDLADNFSTSEGGQESQPPLQILNNSFYWRLRKSNKSFRCMVIATSTSSPCLWKWANDCSVWELPWGVIQASRVSPKRDTQATKMVGWAKVGFQRGWNISPSILQTIVKNENEHRVCRIPCLLIVICVLRFELLRLLVSTNILLACFH